MAQDRDPTATTSTWPVWMRCLVTLAIIWHVGALLAAPLSLPPSVIGTALREKVFRHYTELMFLNHANKFFAPDPGPSHLLRYEVELADGTTKSGTVPNLTEQFPRLLYHRYFMLTERIANGPPDGPPAEPNLDWTRLPPTRFETELARSYADHLLDQYHARRVTLTMVQHLLYGQDQVREGAQIGHENSYRQRALGTFVNQAAL
jgi:hypothetical protein